MKLTYTLTPDPARPHYVNARTELEDEGEPLMNVLLTFREELVPTQLPAVSHTLLRWWHRKNGLPMPDDPRFKTLPQEEK